jgi:beta-N-acetylhexosaminidase
MRAISTNAEEVAAAAASYAQGLETHGVRATLKHFPGLGRSSADTHFFVTSVDAPLADLETRLAPYREALSRSSSLVMARSDPAREEPCAAAAPVVRRLGAGSNDRREN